MAICDLLYNYDHNHCGLSLTHEAYGIIRPPPDSNLPINPLSPHDALEHHFTSLKSALIFLQLGNENYHETGLPIHGNFHDFFTHVKSSSSTTSRELRQQFAVCSG